MTAPAHHPEIERALRRAAYFVDMHLWPAGDYPDVEGWLGNFSNEELPYALHLLDVFTLYSNSFCDRLFVSVIQGLSAEIRRSDDSLTVSRAAWSQFLNQAIFTFPTGENPNAADSGNLFARRARQLLEVDEHSVQSPQACLESMVSGFRGPVVFVDDFIGSGQQFMKTWRRKYPIRGFPTSFEDIAGNRAFYYCPLFCTEQGARHIAVHAPQVRIRPAHRIPQQASLAVANSPMWPDALRATAPDFLRAVAKRTGMPDTDGENVSDWQGFQRLGLAIGFEHGTPDATLPIFYWNNDGWRRLVPRG